MSAQTYINVNLTNNVIINITTVIKSLHHHHYTLKGLDKNNDKILTKEEYLKFLPEDKQTNEQVKAIFGQSFQQKIKLSNL